MMRCCSNMEVCLASWTAGGPGISISGPAISLGGAQHAKGWCSLGPRMAIGDPGWRFNVVARQEHSIFDVVMPCNMALCHDRVWGGWRMGATDQRSGAALPPESSP